MARARWLRGWWPRAAIAALLAWLSYASLTPWAGQGSLVRILRDDVLYTAAVGVAAVASVFAARTAPAARRRCWSVIAAATTLWFAAEVYWAVCDVTGYAVPVPSIGDGLLITSYVLLMVAIGLGFERTSPARHLRGHIDAFVTCGAVSVVGWHWLVQPQVAGQVSASSVTLAIYPILDIAFFTLFVSIGMSGHRRISRPMLCIAASIVFTMIADTAIAVGSTVGYDLPDRLTKVVYFPAILLTVIGAASESAIGGRGELRRRAIALDFGLAPVGFAVLVVLGWATHDAVRGQSVGRLPYALTVLIVLGLVARTQLSTRELRRTAADLDRAAANQRVLASTDALTGLANRRSAQELCAAPGGSGHRFGCQVGR